MAKKLALNPVHPKPGSDSVQVLLGTPTLGIIRIEWYNAMVGMVGRPFDSDCLYRR
jgi:hypothetical protein